MDDIFSPSPNSIGSKGLVCIGDKLLVYRRDNKTEWYPLCIDLPGGAPEPGETPFETFQREVKEEFDLTVTRADVVYAQSYESVREPKRPAYFIVTRLPAESAGDIHFGDEGIDYTLMSPEEYLSQAKVWPRGQELTRNYLAWLQKN